MKYAELDGMKLGNGCTIELYNGTPCLKVQTDTDKYKLIGIGSKVATVLGNLDEAKKALKIYKDFNAKIEETSAKMALANVLKKKTGKKGKKSNDAVLAQIAKLLEQL